MLIKMGEFICMFCRDYTGSLFVFYFVKSLRKGLHDENTIHGDKLENIKSLWKKSRDYVNGLYSGKYESMEESVR